MDEETLQMIAATMPISELMDLPLGRCLMARRALAERYRGTDFGPHEGESRSIFFLRDAMLTICSIMRRRS